MQLLLEFSQNSCKNIYLNNLSEYDLSLGAIKSTYINVLTPGQTIPVKILIPTQGQIVLNAKNMGIQKNLSVYLQDLTEGYYQFDFTVEQQIAPNSEITINTETFCYFNTCHLDCTIDQKTLDLLESKCCSYNDCTGTLSKETQDIETLKLYREGLKSATSLCKKETATEIYKCLQYKLDLLNIDCGCKQSDLGCGCK
jgi:hypothetical protein